MKRFGKQKKLMHLVITCMLVLGFVFAVRTDAKAATAAPSGLTQTDASTSWVKVQWDKVFGSNIYYYWRISPTDSFASYEYGRAYSNLDATITGLNAGKTYYVQAGTAVGSSAAAADVAWSSAIKVVTVPDDVSDIQFTSASETSISLKWNAVSGATSYKVEYTSGNFDNAATAYTNTASIKLSKLAKNTKYNVKVYSQRQDGNYVACASWGKTKYSIPTLPTKVTGVDCDYFYPSLKEGKASFEWDKNEVADGYQYEIYKYNSSKKLLSGTTSYSYSYYLKNSKLKPHQIYKIRVHAYVNTSNNQKKYGKWSSYDYFTRCAAAGTKLTKSGSKIKASWKKVKGATSYTVYLSTKDNGKYKKMGITKKTSYTINKKIKKSTNYYVRIVPNYKKGSKTYSATVNSKIQYSAWCYYYASGRFHYWTY